MSPPLVSYTRYLQMRSPLQLSLAWPLLWSLSPNLCDTEIDLSSSPQTDRTLKVRSSFLPPGQGRNWDPGFHFLQNKIVLHQGVCAAMVSITTIKISTISNETFSLFGFHLVAVDVSLFSSAPIRLFQLVYAFYFVFPWVKEDLVLPNPPFCLLYLLICHQFFNYIY